MIVAASTLTGPGLPRQSRTRGRSCHLRPLYLEVSLLPRSRCAPAPQARALATGLQGFLGDGLPLPAPASALAAARGFAEGNGYLPGQIIDRSA